MASKKLAESTTKGIAGVQKNAITLHDTVTNQTVAIVEAIHSDTEEPTVKIHFRSAVSIDQLDAVNEFCRKKKFCKLLNKGNFSEAQTYAERKFKG